MKFRPQRGSLADAMAEMVELDGSKNDLFRHLSKRGHWKEFGINDLAVEKYGQGIDERINWNTHIVTIHGSGVGFTDGPIT